MRFFSRMTAATSSGNEPLLPMHLRTGDLPTGGDAVTGRRTLLGNADIVISHASATDTSPLYRNAVGDECLYVESGTMRVESTFGILYAEAGDYAGAVRRALDESDRLVAAGLDRAKLFSWEETARRTAAVYREVLAR